jgi:hypothetical protein
LGASAAGGTGVIGPITGFSVIDGDVAPLPGEGAMTEGIGGEGGGGAVGGSELLVQQGWQQ